MFFCKNSNVFLLFYVVVANRVASESPIFFRGKWIDIIKDTSDSEIQKNEVATKTVSVHGVPEDMNLDEPQSFFENGRRSGGGKIEKEAERDESTNVEITSASEEGEKIILFICLLLLCTHTLINTACYMTILHFKQS